MTAFAWICAWYAVGMAVLLFVPKPPRAQAAFDMAERSHPAGAAIVAVLVATFWPLCVIGSLLRFFRR